MYAPVLASMDSGLGIDLTCRGVRLTESHDKANTIEHTNRSLELYIYSKIFKYSDSIRSESLTIESPKIKKLGPVYRTSVFGN